MIKIVHQTNKVSLSDKEKRRKDQSMECMENWRYMFWSDSDLIALAKDEFPQVLEIWDELLGIQRADIGRYMVLSKHGGLYIDTDVIIKGDLAGVIENYNRTRRDHFAKLKTGPLYFANSIPSLPSWKTLGQYVVKSEDQVEKLTRLDRETQKITNYIIYSGCRDNPCLNLLIERCVKAVKKRRLRSLPSYLRVPKTTGSEILSETVRKYLKHNGIGPFEMRQMSFSRCDVYDLFFHRNVEPSSAVAVHAGNTVDRNQRCEWNSSALTNVILDGESFCRHVLNMDQDIAQFPFVLTVLITSILLVCILFVKKIRKR